MAATLSSSFFATSSSSSSSLVPHLNPTIAGRRLSPFFLNTLSLPSSVPFPSPSRGTVSRKLCKVRATTLKEKEEKVTVEDSFNAKTFPGNEGIVNDADPTTNASGSVESWVIKFEQSVNVFLTRFPLVPSQIPILSMFILTQLSQEAVIKILDAFYHDRHYARFFVLETIARVPYFAFISVLHMYESFGWWRRADYLKVHFAESWNEMHHLLIMEELGGNAFWFDRFLAQHIAIFYYFMTVVMYALSPRMAYHFSECVERHAYSTYDEFLRLQGEELKRLPAPQAAIKYYMNEDLYLFDEFQTARTPNSRRPKIENLYDVFVNIRDDEAEHCKTMKICQTHGNLRSPHADPNSLEDDSGCAASQADCEGIIDCVKKSLTSDR